MNDEKRNETIAQLQDLIKDREAFLDKEEPDSVFQKDIDALRWAVDFINAHPRIGEHSYFFTFGTDPQFPVGYDDFVEVHADTGAQADEKFKSRFPCREGSQLLNCAFIYGEGKWMNEVYPQHYAGKAPAVVID